MTDPDGYKVTLVEGESADPLTALTLRVFDMEKATAFYNKLGKSSPTAATTTTAAAD